MGPTVIVASPEQLAELVRGAVSAALAEAQQDAAPALLDRNGAARALGLSTSSLDRLRREGMPSLMIGDAPRFEVVTCLEWLRTNRGSQ